MGFAKGHITWNKGKSMSEAQKKKLSLARIGKPSPMKGKKTGKPAWNKGLTYVLGKRGPKRKSEMSPVIKMETCVICGEDFPIKKLGQKCCSRKCGRVLVGRKLKGNHNGFKNGSVPWNKGIPRTKEEREKISLAHIGKPGWRKGIPLSLEHKQKFCSSRIGIPPWNKGIKTGKPAWNRGISFNAGEKHPQWLGGKSFEPYDLRFTDRLKEQIRERDRCKCQNCFKHQDELFTKKGKSVKLMVHHIDYGKLNSVSENLISLCRPCHLKTNRKRPEWIAYFQRLTAGLLLAA